MKNLVKRCAILARVSTDEQHLDAQVPMLQVEAERRGLTVVAVVEDVGSGRKMKEREGLQRVLQLVEARAIDVLLVAELSRVGRSVAGLVERHDPEKRWTYNVTGICEPPAGLWHDPEGNVMARLVLSEPPTWWVLRSPKRQSAP